MRSKSSKRLIYLACIGSLSLMSGCATQAAAPAASPAPAPAQQQAKAAPDTSKPTMPVNAEKVVPVKVKKAESESPKPGSVAAIIDKMNKSRWTLYWRKNGHYTFTVGTTMDADYKPGVGLTVKAMEGDKHVTCTFDKTNKLVNEAKKPGIADTCSKVLLTLDSDLDG